MSTQRTIAFGAGVVATLIGLAPAAAQVEVEFDAVGDAVIRRTDPGNDGPLGPGATLPDLVRLEVMGWVPSGPGDPYTGSPVDSENAHVARINVVFQGLLNPPGPTASAAAYNPFMFGPSPLLGFVELNMDRNRNTGGQPSSAAVYRYLANIGRFGSYPSSSEYDRACGSVADQDLDYLTPPFFERSGEEFSLALCGCETPVIVSQIGDGDAIFEAGETWIIEGRFFKRAAGYRDASICRSLLNFDFGLYEPLVRLRWSHHIPSDRTTVSLVFPLTPQGAAMLTGEPVQPMDIFYDNGNHWSVREALQDLVNGANGFNVGPLSGLTLILTDGWRHESPGGETLEPDRWRINAIVGTAYAEYQGDSGRFVWTDIGFDEVRGDFNGDETADTDDLALLEAHIAATDGTFLDADGVVNGRRVIPGFSFDFCPYDIDGDGVVGPLDAAFFTGACPGDWDGNGTINSADISAFLTTWVESVGNGTPEGDFNADGSVTSTDISAFLTAWLSCL